MLEYNPAAIESLVQLMWGALMPGRAGGLLNPRLRYFDPDRKRGGVPEDVAALVSELSDTRTTVTLINLSASQARTVIVQGGGYGEHQFVMLTRGGRTLPINPPLLTVRLNPPAAARRSCCRCDATQTRRLCCIRGIARLVPASGGRRRAPAAPMSTRLVCSAHRVGAGLDAGSTVVNSGTSDGGRYRT